MLKRRAQVLADGQDVDIGVSQSLERLVQLVARLAQADHQRALGVDRVADLAGHLLGPAQDVQAAIPAGTLADRLLEPLHGLEVVVEDVGPGVHDRAQAVVRAVEVGDQHLDAHARRGRPHGGDRLGEDPRAAVGQVVTRDAGHDHVLETELADGLRYAAWLIVVEPGRTAGLDRTEPARPGAGVAKDHDRGGALVPALPDVRAAGLLADRVEVQAAEHALQVVVVLARRHPRPDPVRVAAEGGGPIGRREPGQAATHRDRRHLRPVWVGVRGWFEHREVAGHGGSVRLGALRSCRTVAASRSRSPPARTHPGRRSPDRAWRNRAPSPPWRCWPRR